MAQSIKLSARVSATHTINIAMFLRDTKSLYFLSNFSEFFLLPCYSSSWLTNIWHGMVSGKQAVACLVRLRRRLDMLPLYDCIHIWNYIYLFEICTCNVSSTVDCRHATNECLCYTLIIFTKISTDSRKKLLMFMILLFT